ncbi:MAG: hypothetical protein HYR58_03325, partial [Acidobacteria bacterium]|nr:hypothetical protein [Acidobacteriota bacterium]
RAVQLDPNFAPAWAALSRRYNYASNYGAQGNATYRRAEEAASRALALDPEFVEAEGLSIQYHVERGNWNLAYDEANALVRKRPENAQAHFTLAYILRYGGLNDEAIRECEAAMRLDAHERRFRSCSIPFLYAGNIDRAIEFSNLDRGSQWAQSTIYQSLLRQGRVKEAQRMTGMDFIPLIQACFERRPRAEIAKLWAGLEADEMSFPDPEPKYFDGSALVYCGLHDEGLRLLRKAVESNYCAVPAMDNDPLWDSVRKTPEFAAIRKDAMACRDRALAHVQQKNRRENRK